MDNSLACDRRWSLPRRKDAASFHCSGRANRAGTTENEKGIRREMLNYSPQGTIGATMFTMYAQKQQRPTCKGLMTGSWYERWGTRGLEGPICDVRRWKRGGERTWRWGKERRWINQRVQSRNRALLKTLAGGNIGKLFFLMQSKSGRIRPRCPSIVSRRISSRPIAFDRLDLRAREREREREDVLGNWGCARGQGGTAQQWWGAWRVARVRVREGDTRVADGVGSAGAGHATSRVWLCRVSVGVDVESGCRRRSAFEDHLQSKGLTTIYIEATRSRMWETRDAWPGRWHGV
ncbi:hypothetical protein B0H11DRAFT_2370228 [Mycena galericulata]|nr:hypothetical protein B0H11DRAFT_2370228 [Mycena galericulata]